MIGSSFKGSKYFVKAIVWVGTGLSDCVVEFGICNKHFNVSGVTLLIQDWTLSNACNASYKQEKRYIQVFNNMLNLPYTSRVLE